LPSECWIPRARLVAQLGLEQLQRGETADCASLVPFYLRRSTAEERAAPAE
jgi:tRNA A37 threonylcarbamoyladenosine modification protein TsaB